uniref:Uncharacterized protein n=1 Tax=Arion vulgaris TaxID=1028688 RepID=A0A0B6Z9G4_9EUPU
MARNEEKQLARLNRLYLQQQKEEELKKRPPRPRLETLNSVNDVKKWLPSIMRDIDFYVKQMEVTCYPKRQIEEFECRIDRLRGEYKAFIRKLRQLDPDLKTTPWSDRPYMGKRNKFEACETQVCENEIDDVTLQAQAGKKNQINSIDVKNFIPLPVPVLNNDSCYQHYYGFEKPQIPNTDVIEIQQQNEPLQFDFGKRSLDCGQLSANAKSSHDENVVCNEVKFYPQDNGVYESYNCDKKSVHHYDDHNKQETDLIHKATVARNKTSNISYDSNLYSENQQNSSSHTAQVYTLNEKSEENNFSGDRKLKFGGVLVNESSVCGTLNIPYTDSSSDDGDDET